MHSVSTMKLNRQATALAIALTKEANSVDIFTGEEDKKKIRIASAQAYQFTLFPNKTDRSH